MTQNEATEMIREQPSVHVVTERLLQDGYHKCLAIGCLRTIPDTLAFCGNHWRMVPTDEQRAVWRTYRRGKGVGTAEHTEALRLAVEAVAAEEERRGGARK